MQSGLYKFCRANVSFLVHKQCARTSDTACVRAARARVCVCKELWGGTGGFHSHKIADRDRTRQRWSKGLVVPVPLPRRCRCFFMKNVDSMPTAAARDTSRCAHEVIDLLKHVLCVQQARVDFLGRAKTRANNENFSRGVSRRVRFGSLNLFKKLMKNP